MTLKELISHGKLYIVAEAVEEALKVLELLLVDVHRQPLRRVVLGTVKSDIHDLGKNTVGLMLEGASFEVVDLSINVSPEAFVAAVREHQPQIVAMSALITTTMIEMEKTIKALEEAGLRDSVVVMVGGAPVAERFAQLIGADGYAKNAPAAVDKAISPLTMNS
jgi:5-methyltetrahydrofolate--homocysteine methyltransferase